MQHTNTPKRASEKPTSRSTATSSIASEMSSPTHACPASDSASPLRPLPQPMSSSNRGGPPGGSARSSKARLVSAAWMLMMRLLVVYFRASSSL
jgi:hypothetical protein